MSYMENAPSFAGGIQELTLDEIGYVGGGTSVSGGPAKPAAAPVNEPGAFEKLGRMLDNPGETIGRIIDKGLKDLRDVAESGKGTGYWANGIYQIK